MKKYVLIIISIVSVLVTFSFIQEDEGLKKILVQLEKYRYEYPQEKVHLHLDKPYYAIGDDIWFKAYVVNAEKNELSALSKILYVELINDKDSVKQSLRLPLNYGLAAGDFNLTDSLREGNYRIRAYTQWMRNFGEEYFFDRTIVIGNSISNTVLTDVQYTFSKEGRSEKVAARINYSDLSGQPLANREVSYAVDLDFRSISRGKAVTDAEGNIRIEFVNTQPFILKSGRIQTSIALDETKSVSKVFPVKSTSAEAEMQFFPEGGDLVAGLRSRVAFKAVGADGLSVDVSGYIAGRSGDRLTEFKSEHAGMGSFRFHPLPGETYTAHVRYADGSERSYPLPRVMSKGYILTVNNSGEDNLAVNVTTNTALPPDSRITLVAQSNGVVHFVAKNKLSGESFTGNIPKSRFPTGILQLTVFSPDNEPVAERLVFINHHDMLKITPVTSKSGYVKREKVKMDLDITDPKGDAVVGSFSIAVVDENKIPFDEAAETTILSNLLLTSDLRGFIERPNYYFIDADKERGQHLDLLMMTQGWRRFEWKNVLSNAFPSLVYQPEQTVEISGKVTAMNGKPIAGGKVTLFSSAGDVFLRDTLTNANGEFKFDSLYFSDSTKFIIQARNENDRRNVQIELNRIPPQLVTKNKNEAMLEINVNRSILPYLRNSRDQYDELVKYGMINKSILLEEVKVVEKKPVVRNSANLNGAGNADAIVRADQLQNCFNVAQCLQGRLAGVIFMNGIAYSTRSMNSSFRGPVPMQLIIDGAYVEPDFLSMMNPNDIETIEVLRSGAHTAIYGLRGGGGVLVINTKRPELNRDYRSYAPGITSYNPRGFYKSRQFYSPDYDDPEINTRIADLRTTIYWNPDLVPDSSGKASVEFFNADGTGNYKVIIEGVSASGKIGRQVFRYTVN